MSDENSESNQWHDLGNCEYTGCSRTADQRLKYEDQYWFQDEKSVCNEHASKYLNDALAIKREPNRYKNSKRYRLAIEYSSDVEHIPNWLR